MLKNIKKGGKRKGSNKLNIRKIAGAMLILCSIWIFTPPYFLPTELEFYLLFLIPWIGFINAIILPFFLAFIALCWGLWLLGLSLNKKGIKSAARMNKNGMKNGTTKLRRKVHL